MNRDVLPSPLMTSEPGSFARKTIVARKPQILREVSQAHPYPPNIQDALAAFAHEIVAEPIRPLQEDALDVALWNGVWAAFRGRTWLDVPWYFAETFFYRRLMEAVRFYQPGPWQNVDPFAPQKVAELERALPSFALAMDRSFSDRQTAFTAMMRDALWGNRADLSNRTISATAGEGLTADGWQRLLIDDSPRIWAYMADRPLDRVDVIADNSGLELLLDLRLADFLLKAELAHQVRFHLKRMPFFVSDAMVRDLRHTLDRLRSWPPHGLEPAVRLEQALASGRLTLGDDRFWSTCFSYHQIPLSVRQELSASSLVLLKGDVNYRRLLDDRHWPHTAHLADIAATFPAPFVALRTLKGELIVDLEPGQAEALSAVDPTWMINGQRGVIQFVDAVKSGGR
jgi:hypothetical protein